MVALVRSTTRLIPKHILNLGQGLTAYPENSLGFYLQSAIAAGVDVRLMPWFNIFGQGERDQNIEIARSVNRFYDLNGYHTPTGPGSEAARAPHTTGGPNLSRGFAFIDNKTRSEGSHHQKVSYIRNRYGDFAFVGGIDMVPGRWDTNSTSRLRSESRERLIPRRTSLSPPAGTTYMPCSKVRSCWMSPKTFFSAGMRLLPIRLFLTRKIIRLT